MADLVVTVADDQFGALSRRADEYRVGISQLIERYLSYLVAGGSPIGVDRNDPSSAEVAGLAARGGSFDWLVEEPDLYSLADGEQM